MTTLGTPARQVAIVLSLAVAYAGCGGDSPTAPSNVPSVIEGTVALGVIQFAVVNFRLDRAGSLSSRVDWDDATNDIDTALVPARCSVEQVLAEAPGCNEAAAVATDDSSNKPSVLAPSVQVGDHTLIILNFGPGADTARYRFEGFVSGASSPATSRVIEIFDVTTTFLLPDGGLLYPAGTTIPTIVTNATGLVEAAVSFNSVDGCEFVFCLDQRGRGNCVLRSRGPGPDLAFSGTVSPDTYSLGLSARSGGVSLCRAGAVPRGGIPFPYTAVVTHP